jgi:hypothetical protein
MSKARIFNLNYLDINTLTSLTYSSQNASFPVSNLYNYERRSKVWRSTGDSDEWLRLDMGTSVNPKAVIIIGPRNKPISLTPSAVVTLQGNPTDVWTSPAYSKVLTLDDRAIVETSATGLHTEPLRYWRLHIADATNPLGYIELGQVYIGDMWEPSRGAVQFPFGAEYVDYTDISRTEGGQTFADIKSQTMELNPKWFGLTIAEKESIDAHFDAVGIGRPWFIQLDPDLVYSTSNGIYTRYVKFRSAPSYSLVVPGVFAMDMSLTEDL